jgi:hypothetical protein
VQSAVDRFVSRLWTEAAVDLRHALQNGLTVAVVWAEGAAPRSAGGRMFFPAIRMLSTSETRPVTVETGLDSQVPLFVETGVKIVVDTRECRNVHRA